MKVITWDEAGFRQRVIDAGKARGIDSLPEVARRAHLDPKYFRDDRPHPPDGRNIRHVMQIAEALDVDASWLLGLEPHATLEAKESDALEKLAFVSSVAAYLYVALAQRPAPQKADIKRLVKMLVEIIDYSNGDQAES